MKVQPSVKKRCNQCNLLRRNGVLYVYCKRTPRHNQRQG